ncbi:MAG: trypsin-like serine protease [Silicimonas sp.]|nr:trypsin-like serine protease [Silicimonas sp.]RZW10983.1 MAG: trypsin-like serine protease [Paracoccaceae bacterium]MBT8425870.1 trypsin-like serine protease [Silicimonas sp.]NND20711.1 trypsin-like serine protease [Silicimonas sp.]NND41570.1 trypsin-like serine protease [Silicimonas sp.]
MRKFLAVVAASVLTASGLAAQEADESTSLTELMTAYEARGWEGVGLISIGLGGMCTGALIEPRVVLTAAHCLFDQRDGARVDPAIVQFHAGWRNGRSTATRKVYRAIVHPDYVYTGPDGATHVANDVALLELDSDIRLANVMPFATGKRPRKGQSVGVVSYAHDRSSSPSLQEVCHVLARQRGALILSCEVDFGSSGAPVFVEVNGRPQIVSVVSAKADVRGRPVSLGTNLEKPLSELRAILRTGGGMTARANVQAKTVKATEPRVRSFGGNGGGAKFLRP